MQSINPSTGKLLEKYNEHNNDEILSIIKDVSKSYSEWKKTSFKQRSKVLIDIANSLKNDLEIHAKMISLEIGKPVAESRMEVEKCKMCSQTEGTEVNIIISRLNINSRPKIRKSILVQIACAEEYNTHANKYKTSHKTPDSA